jgi:hypothetical protein
MTFTQIDWKILKDFGEKKMIIGWQFRFPNKISRRSSTKSAIQGSKLTDLRRIHVSDDGSDATFR